MHPHEENAGRIRHKRAASGQSAGGSNTVEKKARGDYAEGGVPAGFLRQYHTRLGS
jgi:hypothetical protein